MRCSVPQAVNFTVLPSLVIEIVSQDVITVIEYLKEEHNPQVLEDFVRVWPVVGTLIFSFFLLPSSVVEKKNTQFVRLNNYTTIMA